MFRMMEKCTHIKHAAVMILAVSFTLSSNDNTSFAQSNNSADEAVEADNATADSETNNRNNPIIVIPNVVQGDSTSNGGAGDFCKIMITNSGILGPSIEGNSLDSRLLTGRPGVAQITATNSSYRLSVDAPFGFSRAPLGGNDDISMTATFLGSGSTNFSETPGNVGVRVEPGNTMVETHLKAARLSGRPFPAGNYAAELTLRCE